MTENYIQCVCCNRKPYFYYTFLPLGVGSQEEKMCTNCVQMMIDNGVKPLISKTDLEEAVKDRN